MIERVCTQLHEHLLFQDRRTDQPELDHAGINVAESNCTYKRTTTFLEIPTSWPQSLCCTSHMDRKSLQILA